jgi:hypothetical protein
MASISSDRMKITVTWSDAPMNGRPLTRTWRGPGRFGISETYTEGDTPESRDKEIAAALAGNERFGHDWLRGN